MKLLAYLLPVILAIGLLLGCNKGQSPTNESEGETNSPAVTSTDYHGPEPEQKDICFEAQSNRIPVLMFHDLVVERDRKSLWYDCSISEFTEILDFIELDGRTVISLTDLYEHLTSGKKVPEKSIVLTFDDNYQSFYDLAWPIVQKYKIPVAMFVHTGFVGKTEGRPKMSWETLKTLVQDPLFTVGGHTINHYEDLKDRDLNVQRDELTISDVHGVGRVARTLQAGDDGLGAGLVARVADDEKNVAARKSGPSSYLQRLHSTNPISSQNRYL